MFKHSKNNNKNQPEEGDPSSHVPSVENEDGSEMDLDVDSGANVAAVATEGTCELGSPSMGQIYCYSMNV